MPQRAWPFPMELFFLAWCTKKSLMRCSSLIKKRNWLLTEAGFEVFVINHFESQPEVSAVVKITSLWHYSHHVLVTYCLLCELFCPCNIEAVLLHHGLWHFRFEMILNEAMCKKYGSKYTDTTLRRMGRVSTRKNRKETENWLRICASNCLSIHVIWTTTQKKVSLPHWTSQWILTSSL